MKTELNDGITRGASHHNIEEFAADCGKTSQILSEFPHHKLSVEYGFIKGFQKCQELNQNGWVEIEDDKKINHLPEENLWMTNINSGDICIFYKHQYIALNHGFTHYMIIEEPTPPNK